MVIRLHGGLGAGKTTWIQGLAAGLGATDAVTSPTFSLLHEYRSSRIPLFHWDLYRLDSKTDWHLLDLPDQLPGPGITVVEWPERYLDCWPEAACWDIEIHLLNETDRSITIREPSA